MKLFASLLAILCIQITACSTSEPPNDLLIYNNDGVTIELLNVEDSRCPKDVTCVWAGDASVSMRLSINDSTEDFVLHTNPNKDAGQSIETVLLNHTIRLIDVSPYPVSSTGEISLEDYEIELEVTEI